jgi:hypothetical protein
MPFALNATVGGSVSNAYETLVEAQAYFDSRMPLSGWDDPAGDTDQSVLIGMATRTLDALAQPFKTFFPAGSGSPAYYRVRRQWTGAPATSTQKLAWPRIGMFDHNNNPLDYTILSVSVAAAAVITTSIPHNRVNGEQVLIANIVGADAIVSGPQLVTVLTSTTFSIPVVNTTPGTAGIFYVFPSALMEATAELAGQLGITDRTLDNDVITQGITSVKAGSVAVTFKNEIIAQVIPDAVYNLMPQSWLTDELYELAEPAFFTVASCNPSRTGPYRGEW